MTAHNCIDHKKNLLHFLAVKTAPVRCKLKPSALLRAPLCSNSENTGKCAHQAKTCAELENILKLLSLEHRILRKSEQSSLILFYDRVMLEATLRKSQIRAFLSWHGYDSATDAESCLNLLQKRFDTLRMPHEIGIFLGYPLKDVAGFISAKETAHAIRGDWKIFGEPEESLRIMKLHRFAETLAHSIIEKYQDFEVCLEKIAKLKPTTNNMENANA